MYRECKISEITKSSEKLRGFFMHKEGVQKVFGTLDLFVSLLETEIKYPILQGGILPFWTPSSPLFSSIISYITSVRQVVRPVLPPLPSSFRLHLHISPYRFDFSLT